MQEIQANTGIDVRVGPFVDVGNGFTPETGITLGAADEAELLKTNGAATVDISGRTWAAVTACDGWYDLTLTTTDTNTEGQLTVVVQDDSVCLPVHCHFMVMAQATYISKYTAKDSGFMDVNVKAVSEDTAAADNLESACDNYSVTRGLSGTALPAAAADAGGGLPISDAGGLALDTQLANTNEVTAARMGALTDWINGGRLDNLLDAIPTTAMRGTDGANTTTPDAAGVLPTAVEIRTEMDSNSTQFSSIVGDTNELQTDWHNGGRLDLLLDAIPTTAMRGTDGANTTVPDAAGVAPTAVEIRTEMDSNSTQLTDIVTDTNELQTDWVNGGRLDNLLDAIPTTAMRGTDSANTVVPDAAGVAPTAVEIRTEMDSNSTQLTDIVADTNELQGDWVNGGRLDLLLDAIPTTAMRGTDGANTTVPDAAGTAPTAIEIRTEMDSNSTQFSAIVGDTNELQTDWVNGGRLDLILDTIAVDTTTDIPALIATAQADLDKITGASGVIIQDGTITNASLNADIGSTAYATNKAALAGRKVLDEIKLDHLVAVADADDPVNDSIMAKIAASDGDWSGFDKSTDSLEAIRDRGDADWSSGGATNPNMLLDAEIATVTDQTHITLATGSDINDAYNDQSIVLYDDSNNDYPSTRVVNDYIGATKTITLDSGPVFTLGADDSIKIFVTAPGSTAPTVGQIRTEMDDNSTQLSAIVADTDELQTDWTNGGRLDNLLDAIPTTAMRGTDGANTTVPDAAGVLPTAIEVRTEMDSNSTQLTDIVADTNELQVDWVNGGRLDLILDAVNADTNELQVDWTNGGRLDNLLDAIPTTAMRGTDGANTTVPDAAGVLPTAVEVRTEMDSNSTQFTAIVADTGELQTDWHNGGRLDLILDSIDADAAAILVDTAEIGVAGAGLTNIDLPNQTMDITGDLSGSVGSVTADIGITAAGVDSIFDEVFEGSLTFRQGLRLFLAVLAGKSAGGGTATLTMQDNGDTKARITATVDANGNRTAMTLDGA